MTDREKLAQILHTCFCPYRGREGCDFWYETNEWKQENNKHAEEYRAMADHLLREMGDYERVLIILGLSVINGC